MGRIALTFLIAGVIGIALTLGAFSTRSYRLLSGGYLDGVSAARGEAAATGLGEPDSTPV